MANCLFDKIPHTGIKIRLICEALRNTFEVKTVLFSVHEVKLIQGLFFMIAFKESNIYNGIEN